MNQEKVVLNKTEKHGLWQFYAFTGILEEESTFYRNRLHGKQTLYFPDKKIKQQGYFVFNHLSIRLFPNQISTIITIIKSKSISKKSFILKKRSLKKRVIAMAMLKLYRVDFNFIIIYSYECNL